jgi:signal transduction histidine kinase
LRITGDNEYTLFLDGRELGRDAEWRHLYEYDITRLLTPGKHALGVAVYNSFNEAGMVLGMRVGLANKQVIEVKSDETWLIVSAKVRGWEKRLEPDDSWRKAKILAAFGEKPWGEVDYIELVPPLQPVIVPFWQRGWFQITLLTVCGVVSLISFWLTTQLMVHKKEKELLVRERGRIARDIHDDLGLRVTQLVLQGEVAQSELPAGSGTRAQFSTMCEEAREALRAMDEILWAINPRRDTLREFATYVCRCAQTYLKNTPIQCVLDVESEMSSAAFDLPLRRTLVLAVKEALNNAVKHSHATKLLVKIRWGNGRLLLVLEDDGQGFDPAVARPGRNGLTNMSQRMTEVGGGFHVTSHPGKGCRLEFTLPLARPRLSWLNWRWSDKPKMGSSSRKAAVRAADINQT